MSLTPGARLGPYVIVAPLGAGGMGEVCRARFKREVKTISGLNHPHICVFHDVGQEGDTDYLVVELVENSGEKA